MATKRPRILAQDRALLMFIWIIPNAAFHFSALASLPKAATDRNAIWIAKSESKAGDKIGIKTTFLFDHTPSHQVTHRVFVHDNSNNFPFKFFCIFRIRPKKIFTEKVTENLHLCFILVWSESFMRHPIKSCLNFSSFLSSDLSDYIISDFSSGRLLSGVPCMFSLVEKKVKIWILKKRGLDWRRESLKPAYAISFLALRERIQNLKLAFQSSRNYYYYMKIYGLIIFLE